MATIINWEDLPLCRICGKKKVHPITGICLSCNLARIVAELEDFERRKKRRSK